MRTIKFRGKRIDTGEWCMGYTTIALQRAIIASKKLLEGSLCNNNRGDFIKRG